MNLLNISIFLNQNEIDDFKRELMSNQIVFEVEDKVENNFKYQLCEFEISGIIFCLLPSNSFHKNWDFEIGIRLGNDTEFLSTVKKYEDSGIEVAKQNSAEPYFIIKNTHGPFFFMQYPEFSEINNLIEINANLSIDDYNEIEKVIGLLDENISAKIRMRRSEKDYTIESVKLKFGNKIKNGKDISGENKILSLKFAQQIVQLDCG